MKNILILSLLFAYSLSVEDIVCTFDSDIVIIHPRQYKETGIINVLIGANKDGEIKWRPCPLKPETPKDQWIELKAFGRKLIIKMKEIDNEEEIGGE